MEMQGQERAVAAHLLVLAFFAAGCSSSAAGGDGSVDTWLPGPDGSADRTLRRERGADAARPAACVQQDKSLQAALDAARTTPNALLAVRNAACGTSVYVSGDSSSATTTSLWRIGSVTKTYVAAAVLSLVEEGGLSLSDELSTYVSGVANTDGVTLKMLLDHTSGIYNYTDDSTFQKGADQEWTPSELVALAAAHSPYFAPGAGWHYSNTNYILLGMVLEKVGASEASAVIRARALVPAGLGHTFLDGEETLVGTLATGFDTSGNDVTTKYSLSGPWTAGAMVASGADLCDWVATLYGSTKVLGAAAKTTMTDGAVSTGSSGLTYGLGVMIMSSSLTGGAGEAVGHAGSIFGFETQAFWFSDEETAICAIVNETGANVNAITVAAMTALF